MKIDMDAIVPLESEATKVDKAIADAEEALVAMQEKHEEQTTPLYIRRNEIKAIRKRANQARSNLRDSCEDRELVAEYESALEDLHEASHELAALDDRIRERESWLRQDVEKAEVSHFVQEQRRYKSQAEEHERILADLRMKVKPVRKTLQAAEKRLSTIEELLLMP